MRLSTPTFFAMVLVLSVPFYLIGMNGDRLPGIPSLPLSALMTFVPMSAALILVHGQRGVRGMLALLKSAFGAGNGFGTGWLLVAVLFMPLVCLLEFAGLRRSGVAVPVPHFSPQQALFLAVAFFVAALGEEIGWQGYAYGGLRQRQGALVAAVVLGAIWATWHVIPFLQLGRSADWILWHSLNAIAMRIVMVWLYEISGKSLLSAVLFHTMINLSWALFPNAGSFYDPLLTCAILSGAVCVIVWLYGPATLARFRFASTEERQSKPNKAPILPFVGEGASEFEGKPNPCCQAAIGDWQVTDAPPARQDFSRRAAPATGAYGVMITFSALVFAALPKVS